MAKEPLQDILYTIVNPGDGVVLLVKEYGYRKLSNANLDVYVYIGKGQYGYEFVHVNDYDEFRAAPRESMIYRNKSPQCVKIQLEQLNVYTTYILK